MVYYLFISYNIIKKVSTECPNFVENSRMSRTTTANLQLFNRFVGVAARKLRIHNKIEKIISTNEIHFTACSYYIRSIKVFESNRWLTKIMEQSLDVFTVVRRLRMGCPGHDTGRQSDHPQACDTSFESSLQMGNNVKLI